MYVVSIHGEHVFQNHSLVTIIEDISLDTLRKLDDFLYKQYDIHFDIEEKHVYRHNGSGYKQFDNITNDLDVTLVVEWVSQFKGDQR